MQGKFILVHCSGMDGADLQASLVKLGKLGYKRSVDETFVESFDKVRFIIITDDTYRLAGLKTNVVGYEQIYISDLQVAGGYTPMDFQKIWEEARVPNHKDMLLIVEEVEKGLESQIRSNPHRDEWRYILEIHYGKNEAYQYRNYIETKIKPNFLCHVAESRDSYKLEFIVRTGDFKIKL